MTPLPLVSRYVQQFLGRGLLERLAQSMANSGETSQVDTIR